MATPAKKQNKGVPPIPAAKAVTKRSGGHHNKAANSAAYRQAQAEILAERRARKPVVKLNARGSNVLVVHDGDKPRPTEYDEDLARKVCLQFATNPDMTLNILNADPTMPTVFTFYEWLRAHVELDRFYARSRDIQFDLQAEKLRALARTPLIGEVTVERVGGKDGGSTEVRKSDNVDRTRLIIETDKWLLAKQRPKKYGVQPLEADGNDALQELLNQFRARSKEIEDAS